jgi:ABC-type sugar transport system substrate-binding protein
MKMMAATVLAAGALAATVPAGTASAADQVPCGIAEYVRLEVHETNDAYKTQCFANAGLIYLQLSNPWVTEIWTGNNRVQWLGDDQWQPASPIPKWTSFTWPNHRDGVRIQAIRIS